MNQKELSACDPNELFEAYCLEPDERKAIDIKDELFERIVTLRSYELPNGRMYYEYLPENVYMCCEKMKTACFAHSLDLIASSSKPILGGIEWEDRMYVFRRELRPKGPILEVPGPLPSGHQALGPITLRKKK